MALQFVLGNSGSGKTEGTYKRIVEEAEKNRSKNYLFVVPEQFTLQTQMKLVDLAPGNVITNIDVLSFKRLAYRIFDELGVDSSTVLGETGKNLLLRKVAQDEGESLTVMRPNLEKIGYIEELKSLLSEFVQYEVTPEKLEQYIEAGGENIPPAFAMKLKDVITMYRGFVADMKENSFITAEEVLHELIQVLPQSAILQDAVMVFDDFTGFTPIQNDLLYALLQVVSRMEVILTMDASEVGKPIVGEHDLFAMSKKTIAKLTAMAEELGVPVLAPEVYADARNKRFSAASDLAFLEEQLFRGGNVCQETRPEALRIMELKSPNEELVWTAREIVRLVREENYRYGEIAVVTGDVEVYGRYAKEIFARYEIPCFIDQTTQVLFHPFTECVRAILEIVEEHFSYQAMMRFLRSGFMPLDEKDVDELDNFLLATGIRGEKGWKETWQKKVKRNWQGIEGETLEGFRKEIYELLAPVYEAFRAKDAKVEDEVMALYTLLQKLECGSQLEKQAKVLKEQGESVKAQQTGSIYRITMELLEKLYYLFQGEHMSISDFAELIDAGLSAEKVRTLPPEQDSVTMGDIERTRLNPIKVLFFVGVNDGVVPKAAGGGGIISQYERELLLDGADMELAPGPREQAFIQRFYLYRNLTKPSRKLYISYSLVDKDGKAIRPSYLIGQMQKLFQELAVEKVTGLFETPNYTTPQAAMDYLLYGKRDAAWYVLAKVLLSSDTYKKLMEDILKAPFTRYEKDSISQVVASSIYGRTLDGNVTRLEEFAACAYHHFLDYGLRLREREEAGLDMRSIGNIYHAALCKYGERLKKEELSWDGLEATKQEAYATWALGEALLDPEVGAVYDSPESRYMTERMKRIFHKTIRVLTKQIAAGKFAPTEFEVKFKNLEDVESLKVALSEGHSMRLTGTIDRLDVCTEGQKAYVKIVDYKTGNKTLDLVQVYYGQDIQLVTYLDVAMEHYKKEEQVTEVIPAAMFYYHLDEPVIALQNGEELSEEAYFDRLLKALRPQGLFSSSEDAKALLDVKLADPSRLDDKYSSDAIPYDLKGKGAVKAETARQMATSEEFATITEYVRRNIQEMGEAIYQGDIAVNPYYAQGVGGKTGGSCAYCPYGHVCGFDVRVPGYAYRFMDVSKKDEALLRMETENALAKGQEE